MANNQTSLQLVQAALICTLLIILGLFPGIPVGIIPVTIVVQNLGVMLAGELLRPRAGLMAVGVFLVLVALGLPFLAGGRGGVAIFVGPTGGYLLGWLLAPALNAWLLDWTKARERQHVGVELAVAVLVLVGFVDLLGTAGVILQARVPFGLALMGNLAVLPGDLVKAFLAVVIARRLRRNRRRSDSQN